MNGENMERKWMPYFIYDTLQGISARRSIAKTQLTGIKCNAKCNWLLLKQEEDNAAKEGQMLSYIGLDVK